MNGRHSIIIVLFWNLQYYSIICFRWNFSVGQHDISFLEAILSDDDGCKCSSQDNEEFVDWNVRVSISSGLVAAVRSYGSKETEEVLWSHQFDAPIAAVWRLNGGYIEPVSILSQEVMPQLVDSSSQQTFPQGPVMYIGNVDYSSRTVATRRTIRHSLMLLWFNVSTLLLSVLIRGDKPQMKKLDTSVETSSLQF